MNDKIRLAWFIDTKNMKDYEANAKLRQLNDFIDKTKFFNKFHVMVIPAKENKFSIIETEEDINIQFSDKKELENLLSTIKGKFKECLTVYL
jgi:vesicle coat complex subunit